MIHTSVQSLSCLRLFATPWTVACQASLSITNSRSLLKVISIESVIPSNHLILCCPLLLLPLIFPSIRVFSLHWVTMRLKLSLYVERMANWAWTHSRPHTWPGFQVEESREAAEGWKGCCCHPAVTWKSNSKFPFFRGFFWHQTL